MPESDRGGGSGGNDHGNHTNDANDGALVEILREELAEKNRAAPAIGADRLKRSPRAAMVADLEVIIWSTIGQWE